MKREMAFGGRVETTKQFDYARTVCTPKEKKNLRLCGKATCLTAGHGTWPTQIERSGKPTAERAPLNQN